MTSSLAKRYAGIRVYNGLEFPGAWPPIFDAETWHRLQLAMKLRQEAPYNPSDRKYLLTGLIYCGICGGRLNGTVRTDRPGSPPRRVYRCHAGNPGRDNCGGVRRSAEPLEAFVRDCVFYRLNSPELAALLASGRPDDAQLQQLLDTRSGLQQRLNGLADQFVLGELTKDQVARATATAQAELMRIEREIDLLSRRRFKLDVSVGETLRQAWDNSDSVDWQRNLFSLLITQVVVHPGASKPWYEFDGQRYRFDPELIEISWSV